MRSRGTTRPGDNQQNADKPYLNFPIETLPGLRNTTGLHPFGYVPVRPFSPSYQVTGLASPFVAQSVEFGSSYLAKSPMDATSPGATEGTISFWFYHPGTWNSVAGARLFQLRVGTTIVCEISTASNGRLTFFLSGSSARTALTGTFSVDRWHHVLWSYKAGSGGWNRVYLDGSATEDPLNGAVDLTSATLGINGDIARASAGAQTGGTTIWPGSIGHLYINPQLALDITDSAQRAKFILGGKPVNLGGNGETPTGAVPAFYFNGVGASWNNLGGAGGLTMTGTLVAGTAPALP